MDVLVVLGTTAAWFYGVLLLFIGNPFLKKFQMMDSMHHMSLEEQ
jgi:hypothetical protein